MRDRRAAIGEARAAWPGVHVEEEEFLAYAAERIEGERLDHLGDLYLACACARGDEAALAAFEARYMPQIARALGRLKLDASEVGEVQQLVRQSLFLAEGGKPRIAAYGGSGPLGAWVRTIAIRVAIDMVRRERRVRGHDEVVLEGILVEGPEAPDLAHLKRTHGDDLREALADGIAGLEAEDQLMLRLHYVDGLSTAKIAALEQQHPVTVLRRLGRVRAQLLRHIKRFMRRRGVTGSQLDSIVRLVQSDFHARLSGMLAEAPTVQLRRPPG